MEKSPSFLASESEHAQKTKKLGEFSCQILTGSGLMNAKTFQRLINHICLKSFSIGRAEDTFLHQHATVGGMIYYSTARLVCMCFSNASFSNRRQTSLLLQQFCKKIKKKREK